MKVNLIFFFGGGSRRCKTGWVGGQVVGAAPLRHCAWLSRKVGGYDAVPLGSVRQGSLGRRGFPENVRRTREEREESVEMQSPRSEITVQLQWRDRRLRLPPLSLLRAGGE